MLAKIKGISLEEALEIAFEIASLLLFGLVFIWFMPVRWAVIATFASCLVFYVVIKFVPKTQKNT